MKNLLDIMIKMIKKLMSIMDDIDKIDVNEKNAGIFAPVLVRKKRK